MLTQPGSALLPPYVATGMVLNATEVATALLGALDAISTGSDPNPDPNPINYTTPSTTISQP